MVGDTPKTLFCLEAYVEKVEKLPTKLRGDNLPAFAVRFLDYSPVIVTPPPKLTCSRSAFWYGRGKRCLFDEEADLLRASLRKRSAAALLVLQVDNKPRSSDEDDGKRRLYGSGTVSLSDFCDDDDNKGPQQAVKTWGRRQCKLAITDSYDKIVGVVTLSVSLSSFDPSLRAVLAPPPPPYLDQSTQEVSCRVEEATLDERTGASPSSSSSSSLRSTIPISPPSVRSSIGLLKPPTPPSPCELAPGDEHCVDSTLRMPQASAAAFDEESRSILSASLAQSAGVHSAEILSWREGSLIVDARIRFGDDRRAAKMFADKLVYQPDPYLVPYDLFGPFKVMDAAVKRCNVASVDPPSPPTPPQTEVSAAPVPSVAEVASDGVEEARRTLRADENNTRTLDVFRGEAACFEGDDGLGECPPPLFLEARRRCVSMGDFPRVNGEHKPVPPLRKPKKNVQSPRVRSPGSQRFPVEEAFEDGHLQRPSAENDGPPPPLHAPEVEEELNAAYHAVRGKDGLVTISDLMRATSLFDKKSYLAGDLARNLENETRQAPRRRITYDDALALISTPET